jgi:circadian clock protein KaiC
MEKRKARPVVSRLPKCRTGISGLDEITFGGLPRGRPTLVCGGAGCGKTMFALEFITRGIQQFGEPGVVMSFEETAEELSRNAASLGFDLPGHVARGKLAIDYVRIERSEIEETGEYDLEGLFVRLGSMVAQTGARRVALDTIDALFAGIPDQAILRAELRRLFRWLKDRRLTAVITAESGSGGTLTRNGLEEYVSDCVIFLDHRVRSQVATRRLRVVKYRGSHHGTNEYPTMIDESGLSVLPISSLGLRYPVTTARVSSGIRGLDEMLGGTGYYKGTSVLVSGGAGTGKTSIATAFADSICRHGGRCLYLCFEESADQVMRNIASIGTDLRRWVDRGLLRFRCQRPSLYGLESHLGLLHKEAADFGPAAVIVDPVTSLQEVGEPAEVKAMLTRTIDFLKNCGATALFTSLSSDAVDAESSVVGVSSLMDTWLQVRCIETQHERNRILYVLKSRGMAHSNQMREFILSSRGIELRDVYVGPGMVLTGSARLVQESRDAADTRRAGEDSARHMRDLREQREALETELAALRQRIGGLQEEIDMSLSEESGRLERVDGNRRALTLSRSAAGAAARRRDNGKR